MEISPIYTCGQPKGEVLLNELNGTSQHPSRRPITHLRQRSHIPQLETPSHPSTSSKNTDMRLRKRFQQGLQATRVIRLLEQCYQTTQAPTILRLLKITRTVETTPVLAPRFFSEVARLRAECSQDKQCRVAAEFVFTFFKTLSEGQGRRRGHSD